MLRLTTLVLSFVSAASLLASDTDNLQEIASFDFEEIPTDYGWRTYDLDGKACYFFGKPRGWYMSFDGDNGVCAATSLFNYDVDYDDFVEPETVPADDWLFSPAIQLPYEGNFSLSWDSRAGGDYDVEDYEIRVIDAELLDQLEESFTTSMTLTEVRDIMVANSTLLEEYLSQDNQWLTHTLDITSLRGKNMSFIWRYRSNHTQLIYIDNYSVKQAETFIKSASLHNNSIDIQSESITFHGNGVYTIYDISGSVVTSGIVDTTTTIEPQLSQGIYVIRFAGASCKLIK